jgi:hypothetical protein
MLGAGKEAVCLQRFAPRAEFLREDVAARAERPFDEFWWPDNPVPRECLHQVPRGATRIRGAWHRQDRERSASSARAFSGCRLALATRTDSSASLVASVKIRSADERV